MNPLWLAPFLVQGAAMAADEIYCHHRREIPIWERVGHPLDTLTVLACLAICAFLPATDGNLTLFIAAGAFSCLFITKDEFVHRDLCDGLEHWLHAVLFVTHPITLWVSAQMWRSGGYGWALRAQFGGIAVFFIYQVYKGIVSYGFTANRQSDLQLPRSEVVHGQERPRRAAEG